MANILPRHGWPRSRPLTPRIYWLSNRGTKGVDHLGGARDGIEAVYESGLSYEFGWHDIQEAKGRARR